MNTNATDICIPSTVYAQMTLCVGMTLLFLFLLTYIAIFIRRYWRTPLTLLFKDFFSGLWSAVTWTLVSAFVLNQYYGLLIFLWATYIVLDYNCDTQREFYIKETIGLFLCIVFSCCVVNCLAMVCFTQNVTAFIQQIKTEVRKKSMTSQEGITKDEESQQESLVSGIPTVTLENPLN